MPRQTITQSSWYDNARQLKDPKPRLEWDEVTEWEEANLCNKITIFDLPLECPFPLTNRRNAYALIENFLEAVRYHRELFPYWRRRAIKYFIWREWFVIRNNDEWKDYRNHPLYKNRDALRDLAKKQFQNAMGLASALLFVLHGLYTNDWELEFLLKGQQKLIDTYNMCDVNTTLWNRHKMLDILFIECEWLKDTLLEAHMKEKKEMDEEWEHRQTKTLEEMEVFIDETPELMDEDGDGDNAQGNAQNNAQNNAQGITQNNTQNHTQGIDQGNAQDIDPWDVPITICMNQWDDQSFAQQFEQMLRRQEKDLRQWDAQCYAQGLNESLVHSMAQILKFGVEDAQYFARRRARYIAQRRAQDINQRKARSIAQERARQQRNRRQARIRAQIRAQRRAQGRTQGRTQEKARGIAQNNTQRIVQYFDRDTSQNIIQSLPGGNTKKSVKAFMEGVYQELARGIAQDKAQQRRTQRRAHRTVQENIRETTQNTAKENGQEGTQNNLQDSTATAPHHQRTDSQAPEEPVNTAVPPRDPRPALPARPVNDDEDIYGYSGGEAGNTKKK